MPQPRDYQVTTPVIRQGLIPLAPELLPVYLTPLNLNGELGEMGDFGDFGVAFGYYASRRNIARLIAKMKRLKRAMKGASRGKKRRLRRRLRRAQRRMRRINKVVRRAVARRRRKGKSLTDRQRRMVAALKRRPSRVKRKQLKRRLAILKAQVAGESKAADVEDEQFASELEEEVRGEPEPSEAELDMEMPGMDDDFTESDAVGEPEKKPWERPEVLALGAIVLLGGFYLMSQKNKPNRQR